MANIYKSIWYTIYSFCQRSGDGKDKRIKGQIVDDYDDVIFRIQNLEFKISKYANSKTARVSDQ